MKKKTTILSIFLAVFMALTLNVGNVKAAATGQDIVNYAKKFIGTPYVWGGTSPSGFDCSGFVQYVYRNAAGIELPRVDVDQMKVGTPVSRNNLQPGDLISPHPGHIGIYIGGGNVIHSPKAGDVVKISTIESFGGFYAGARINGITNYSKEFIASVQRDLARCSLYTGPATGIIDAKTKQAIRSFRSTMGLPVNDTLDSSVVDALNQIVQKHSLSVNTNLKYATRFVQWWIGSTKNGVYDSNMKEAVRQWQIKAGIWSAAGADGVIREKDWNKILKQVDDSGYTRDFVASVQRDLRKCSFYNGEATGNTDGKTKDAIRYFRNTMGLSVNDTLDASVVDALNQIVQKHSLSVNTNLKYATRFIQWWIGIEKNGIYDNKTKEAVRQWQIKAGIWSAAGADGVIREKIGIRY